MVVADKRLWLTADRERAVPEGSAEAAFLFCSPGDEVSDEDAKQYGLKAKGKPADKEAEAPANKQAPPAANKSGVTVQKRT